MVSYLLKPLFSCRVLLYQRGYNFFVFKKGKEKMFNFTKCQTSADFDNTIYTHQIKKRRWSTIEGGAKQPHTLPVRGSVGKAAFESNMTVLGELKVQVTHILAAPLLGVSPRDVSCVQEICSRVFITVSFVTVKKSFFNDNRKVSKLNSDVFV